MAFGLDIDINANIARFSSQLDTATRDMSRFARTTESAANAAKSALAGIGVGLGIGAFAGAIKSSIDFADSLKDLSKSTSLSVEQLSGLSLASKQSGADLESIATAINKLSVSIGKDGEKFRQLGVDAKDPLQAFAQFADVFNAIDDPQKRAAVGAAALGKAWATSAPLLAEGGDAIRKMIDSGSKYGQVTTAMALEADQFNDSLEVMEFRLTGVRNKIGAAVLPVLNDLLAKFGEVNDKAGSIRGFNDLLRFATRSTPAIQNLIPPSNTGGATGSWGPSAASATGSWDTIKKPTSKAIAAFTSSSDTGSAGNTASGRGGSVITKTVEDGSRALENLRSELALIGQVDEASKIRYETEFGSLRNISAVQKERLIDTAKELDFYRESEDIFKTSDDLAKKQRDTIQQTTISASKLKAELADLSPPANGEFEARLYKIDDALKAGIFSAKEAKAEFDKLGALQVGGNFDVPKEQVSQLSEFAVQASHNLQTSLADALQSGFSTGLDGMLKSFAGFLQQAAAQAAASQILELFSGGKGSGSGILKSVIGGIAGGIGGLFGGGASTFNGTGPLLSFAGARAGGGPVGAGGTYLVGEKGPELFTPRNSGAILPTGSFGGRSSGDIYQTVNISVQKSPNESADQTGQKIAEAFMRSIAKDEINSAQRPGNSLNRTTSF